MLADVDITGYDIKSVGDAASALGAIGLLGAAIGLGLGALFSSYAEDKGWGNPSSAGVVYWPICAIVGIMLLGVVAAL